MTLKRIFDIIEKALFINRQPKEVGMSQGDEPSGLAVKPYVLEEAFFKADGALGRELITGYRLGSGDPCPKCRESSPCEEPCESFLSYITESNPDLVPI